jgi:hypothetical protein
MMKIPSSFISRVGFPAAFSLFFAWTLLSPAPAPAQTQIRSLSVACRTASGSVAANEFLARLRAISPETPELLDAITACQERKEDLQKQETSQWDLATAARDRFECQTARRLFQGLFQKRTAYQRQARDELNKLASCTPSAAEQSAKTDISDSEALEKLRQARGAFNTRNFVAARPLAQSIASRSDQIGEDARALMRSIELIELNDKRHRDALVAITLRQFEKACQLLREIESSDRSFAGLAEAKARAGGCPVVETTAEKLKPDYERALRLLETKQYEEAVKVLQDIKAKDKNYQDVNRLLAQAEAAIRLEKQKSIDQRVAETESSVEELMRQGELDAALARLTAAQSLHSKRLEDLKAKVDKALIDDEESLLPGINSYYGGKYNQARLALSSYVRGKHPPRLLAVACFYLGAAAIADYYLAGAADPSKKKEGMLLFTEALRHYPDFEPRWNTLSPKVKGVYTEATGRQPKGL